MLKIRHGIDFQAILHSVDTVKPLHFWQNIPVDTYLFSALQAGCTKRHP
jgi:hypothetical protein